MKLKAVIVDDEKHSLETTEMLLSEHCSQIEILGKESKPEKGIKLIDKLKPNLVFLDIKMPGISGLEILNKLKYTNFETIFTTAYDHYAISAFKVGAIHYLLKPIDPKELIDAVQRAEQRLVDNNTDANFNEIVQMMSTLRKNKIALPSSTGIDFYDVDDIIRCESDSNYTKIFLKDKQITISKTLKEIEKLLSSRDFLRIHHSHLINLDHLIKYIRGEGGSVILSNNDEILVSRNKKNDLMRRIK